MKIVGWGEGHERGIGLMLVPFRGAKMGVVS
jgi:hypothetical protein